MAASWPSGIEDTGVPLLRGRAITAFPVLRRVPEEVFDDGPPLIALRAAGLAEREARLSEITDAAPVPEWVYFLGKFVGLGLVLVVLQALMMAAGMLIQVLLGHFDFEIDLYARILFGLQLPDYLLFALLALVVHALVNHKCVGHLVVVIAYGFMAFGPALGVGTICSFGPILMTTNMRGFKLNRAWLWSAYWAWGLLLAGGDAARCAKLRQTGSRLAARRHFTQSTAHRCCRPSFSRLGGFVLNTNVLDPTTTPDSPARRMPALTYRHSAARPT
jgi:hypothetical protein